VEGGFANWVSVRLGTSVALCCEALDSRIPFWKIEGSVMSLRFKGGSRDEEVRAFETGSETTLLPAFLVSLAGGVFPVDGFRDGPIDSKSCNEKERREVASGRDSIKVSCATNGSAGGSSADRDIRPGVRERDSKPNADGGLLPKKTLSSS
jgi:hypothetical protein